MRKIRPCLISWIQRSPVLMNVAVDRALGAEIALDEILAVVMVALS